MNAEERRLQDPAWRRWGPYLSERAWGTVREDYSSDGSAWTYLPHDDARSRAYRWNEDGLLGFCDDRQRICFALTLWNGKDPILKERFYGLGGEEGRHGEDVKELYYFLDATPSHGYQRALYKYPQAAFPYELLRKGNAERSREEPEYELLDTGVFDEDRYFDVQVEYAKGGPDDVLIRIQASNRGPEAATLHLLPTVWFRNTWSWSDADVRPSLYLGSGANAGVVELDEVELGRRRLYCDGRPEFIFTENESNRARLWKSPNPSPYVKDAFHAYLVDGQTGTVNPAKRGTKAAAHYSASIPAGETWEIRLRLTDQSFAPDAGKAPFGDAFDHLFDQRRQEADEFYAGVIPHTLSDDARNVMRQAFAGMLWSKQYYHYGVSRWLEGDPAQPAPPAERKSGRNSQWKHLYAADVISMPDTWEYPWFAAWDLAFHCISLSLVDPGFAKQQLLLLMREWYMHPSGQIPAYEWAFGDVNPPVQAWSALRVFRIDKKRKGKGDYDFLERMFHKLLLNFTWWVNRKDKEDRHLFQGGFLGLDNIGLFDRGAKLPNGGFLDQADGTAWMGFFCLNLMSMALELAEVRPAYEDVASKFFEHFTYIGRAMTTIGGDQEMWNEEDGFFYDVLCYPDGGHRELRVRSMVGIIPLFAVDTLDPGVLERFHLFRQRVEWFTSNCPDLVVNLASVEVPGVGERRLLSVADEERLRASLRRILDEEEFLSPYGVRSVSKYHAEHPFQLAMDGTVYEIGYEPAESRTGLFGGNSNWRGPVWFPVNYLLIEALQKFDYYFGESFRIEFPTGYGKELTLAEVAAELSRRLSRLFLRDEFGHRAAHGGEERYQTDPHWKDLVLFYEYFHGDTGKGLGASHQTGWTGLVTKLLQQSGE